MFYLKTERAIKSNTLRVLSVILVVFVSFLQILKLSAGDLVPNLAASSLIALSFWEKNLMIVAIALFLSVLMLLYTPFPSWQLIAFAALFAGIALFGRRFFDAPLIGAPVLAVVFTFLFYLLASPQLFVNGFKLIAEESAINGIAAYLFSLFFRSISSRQS